MRPTRILSLRPTPPCRPLRIALVFGLGIVTSLWLLNVTPPISTPRKLVVAPATTSTQAWFAPPPSPSAESAPLTPEAAAAPLSDDDNAHVIKPTGMPEHLSCAVYAGPLRWRRHPLGRGAPSQSLRALPLSAPPIGLAPPKRTLVPFTSGVLRLLPDGGPFAQASATNAAFLRGLDQNRLFWSFRQTAGLRQPQHARPFGGWERPGAGIRGHFVGHYLAALATGGAGGDESLVALARSALSALSECQRANDARGWLGYIAAFPPDEFDKVEGLSHGPHGDAWVPHYATQKVLSGLHTMHVELGLAAALPILLGMAEYVWRRSAAVHRAKGEAHWAELLNYEVGALSEVYVHAAESTANATWLEAAALFDRRCFTGPLALAGSMHPEAATAGNVDVGAPFAQGVDEAAVAAGGMRGMHANAQLAFILGAASRYEATGEANARLAAEAYFRAAQRSHTYLAGGSSFMEEWRAPGGLAETLTHRGPKNWAAHDHQESCVTHHSMLLSRKLLGWGGRACKSVVVPASGGTALAAPAASVAGARDVWRRELHAHADWLDRALYNGVLGTQRGKQPGAMVYMMPLGGGVSKAGGNHGFSNGENHFWCCTGSGIEAFTRMHASVFYERPRRISPPPGHAGASFAPPRELVVLQHVSSSLEWREPGCNVTLRADAAGDVSASAPLVTTLMLSSLSADAAGRGVAPPACILRVHVRVPGWAVRARVELLGAPEDVSLHAPLPPTEASPPPASFVSRVLKAGEGVRVRLWTLPTLRLPSGDAHGAGGAATESGTHAHNAPGGAAPTLFGDGGATSRVYHETSRADTLSAKAVLRGVTHGPLLLAALTDGERTMKVAPSSRIEHWLRPVPTAARTQLVTLEIDGAGGSAPVPHAAAAVPTGMIEHVIAAAVGTAERESRGGASACPPHSTSAVLSHSGIGNAVGVSPRPPQPPALTSRRGGSDLVHAATWRVARWPAGVMSMSAPEDTVVLEAMDRPDALLSIGPPLRGSISPPLRDSIGPPLREGARSLRLLPALPAAEAVQRWRMRPLTSPPPTSVGGRCDDPNAVRVALESADAPGTWVRRAAGGSAGALEVAKGPMDGVAAFTLRAPLALYPPMAHWAASNTTCTVANMAHCRSTYLMVPMRELLDETYSSHLCVTSAEAPSFCH